MGITSLKERRYVLLWRNELSKRCQYSKSEMNRRVSCLWLEELLRKSGLIILGDHLNSDEVTECGPMFRGSLNYYYLITTHVVRTFCKSTKSHLPISLTQLNPCTCIHHKAQGTARTSLGVISLMFPVNQIAILVLSAKSIFHLRLFENENTILK